MGRALSAPSDAVAGRSRMGETYVDVGTLHGYREAVRVLGSRPRSTAAVVT